MFYVDNRAVDKHLGTCKKCLSFKRKGLTTEYSRRIVKTKDGLLKRIYSTQIALSKKRKHNPPKYSLKEFIDAFINEKSFVKLFDNWADNNFIQGLKPSCDRIDDFSGYSFENIQFVTWDFNNSKNHKSERRKQICREIKKSHIIPIAQYSPNRKLVFLWINGSDDIKKEYKSINNIRAVCRKRRPLAYGYYWEYIREESELNKLMEMLNINKNG